MEALLDNLYLIYLSPTGVFSGFIIQYKDLFFNSKCIYVHSLKKVLQVHVLYHLSSVKQKSKVDV